LISEKSCAIIVAVSPHLKERTAMTPEQRLDRAERMLLMLVQAGRRARREWSEKVNILIDTQIAMSEQLMRTNEQIKDLTASQAKTDEALRRFINSLRKGRNGNAN
jgi:hypothetical protein